MKEKNTFHINGYLGLFILLIMVLTGGWLVYLAVMNETILTGVLGLILWLISALFVNISTSFCALGLKPIKRSLPSFWIKISSSIDPKKELIFNFNE